MQYRHQELLFGLFMLSAGCGLLLHAFSPQYSLMAQDIQTDPMFFPKIILSGWILCASAIVVRAFTCKDNKVEHFEWLRCLIAVAVMAVFVLLFDKLGNLPCAFACFFALGLILGNPHPRRLLLISFAYAVFIDMMFRYVLKMSLPDLLEHI